MALQSQSIGVVIKPPLPQLGKQRLSKNPLQPSKDQEKTIADVGFVSPFSSSYSTVSTVSLDQAEEDYRQVLCKISESKKDALVVGKKATDIPHAFSDEIVITAAGTPGSSSYYSDDD